MRTGFFRGLVLPTCTFDVGAADRHAAMLTSSTRQRRARAASWMCAAARSGGGAPHAGYRTIRGTSQMWHLVVL